MNNILYVVISFIVLGCSENKVIKNENRVLKTELNITEEIKVFREEINISEKNFILVLEDYNESEAPILWGYNCYRDYNEKYCSEDIKYYSNNYDISFE